MPRLNKPPRVLLLPRTLGCVTRWSAASPDEQWGFLIGRLVDGVYRVSRATREDADERSPTGFKLDYSKAYAAELRLHKGGRDIPVGAWHSHPRGDDWVATMQPQISRIDKRSVVDGAVELICATSTIASTMPRKPVDFLLARRVKTKGGITIVCRIEAWLRRKQRFLPCELEVMR